MRLLYNLINTHNENLSLSLKSSSIIWENTWISEARSLRNIGHWRLKWLLSGRAWSYCELQCPSLPFLQHKCNFCCSQCRCLLIEHKHIHRRKRKKISTHIRNLRTTILTTKLDISAKSPTLYVHIGIHNHQTINTQDHHSPVRDYQNSFLQNKHNTALTSLCRRRCNILMAQAIM